MRRRSRQVVPADTQRSSINNALQVTWDIYLARIYATALALVRVPAVNGALDRKLAHHPRYLYQVTK